jgi:hypothetical protein
MVCHLTSCLADLHLHPLLLVTASTTTIEVIGTNLQDGKLPLPTAAGNSAGTTIIPNHWSYLDTAPALNFLMLPPTTTFERLPGLGFNQALCIVASSCLPTLPFTDLSHCSTSFLSKWIYIHPSVLKPLA